MWGIWAKEFLPPALKSCPKCNKSPNLVTLSLISFSVSLYLQQRLCLSQFITQISKYLKERRRLRIQTGERTNKLERKTNIQVGIHRNNQRTYKQTLEHTKMLTHPYRPLPTKETPLYTKKTKRLVYKLVWQNTSKQKNIKTKNAFSGIKQLKSP